MLCKAVVLLVLRVQDDAQKIVVRPMGVFDLIRCSRGVGIAASHTPEDAIPAESSGR